MYDYKLQKINKIPCIISENNNIFTCTILVLVKVGSRYENKGGNCNAQIVSSHILTTTDNNDGVDNFIKNDISQNGVRNSLSFTLKSWGIT